MIKKIIVTFYLGFIKVFSPTVIGILVGIITGIDINLLTDAEQSAHNKLPIFLFGCTLLPMLVIIHIRTDFESAFQRMATVKGGTWKEWKQAVTPKFNRPNIFYLVSVVFLGALIWLGISNLHKMDSNTETPSTELLKAQEANRNLMQDTTVLRRQIRQLESKLIEKATPNLKGNNKNIKPKGF